MLFSSPARIKIENPRHLEVYTKKLDYFKLYFPSLSDIFINQALLQEQAIILVVKGLLYLLLGSRKNYHFIVAKIHVFSKNITQ